MKITISPFDAATNSVTATFIAGDVTHTRQVNAVLTDGKYDRKATAARVDEVGKGVAVKIAAGVITNPPDPAPLPATDE